MLAEDADAEEVEAVRVSAWHAAALHLVFFLVCLVATIALRSPPWLLATLLYCGARRGAFAGRHTYPTWMFGTLWVCTLLSAACTFVANLTTLVAAKAEVQDAVWITCHPLWVILGVQRWSPREWVDTILSPSVSSLLFGADVLLMKHLCRRGLHLQHSDHRASSGAEGTLSARWPRVTFVLRLAAAPLLAALAWAVAWFAPPSGVGLCLEALTFVFAGASFGAVWVAAVAASSPTFRVPSERRRAVVAGAVARGVNALFGVSALLLLIVVTASHIAMFDAVADTYGVWCAQIGVGRMKLGTEIGVRRALQLAGMALLVAGISALETYVTPAGASGTAAATERTGLLVEVTEEVVEDSGEPHRTGDERDQSSGGGAVAATATAVEAPQPHSERSAASPQTADVDSSLDASSASFFSISRTRFFFLRTKHLVQALAIASVMTLLLYALYFPCVVSLAVWLIHLCCCAGGFVTEPLAPTRALRTSLLVSLLVLSADVVAQYACLVVMVNPSTAAWVWLPALPYRTLDSGLLAVQVFGEHAIVLCLGLYVSVAGGCQDRQGAYVAGEAPPAVSSHAAEVAATTFPHVEQAPDDEQRQPLQPGNGSGEEDDDDDDSDGPESPHRNWMLSRLRSAAGDAKELRAVFETAVGRSPRSAELNRLAVSTRHLTLSSFHSVRRLTVTEVFYFIASGPFYTYVIIISLFVLGTSAASMDSLHATCLVLSLLFSTVGSNAVLYRRLRTLPPVWVAVVVGVQLAYGIFRDDSAAPSTSPPAKDATKPSSGPGWEGYVGVTALTWSEAAPYLVVQLVLLWCCRCQPHHLTNWTRVWQCLVFRCRWTHVFRVVHNVAGFTVLLWIVLLLPRSVNVTLLVLLLLSVALLNHLGWHGLAYVWRRYLIVGYCGVVLLAMLLVEFAPMQPRLWRLLYALGCPIGSESVCARDVGLPSDTTAWLTPLSLPWWFVIVLATAAGTPYALPSNLVLPLSSGAMTRWSPRLRAWWPQLRANVLTVVLLVAMTYAALHRPSILTTAYLVGPVCGIRPAWTLGVAAVHTTLQCTYQFWFSPPVLDTYTLWGTPLAELLGLWKAGGVGVTTASTSAPPITAAPSPSSSPSPVPSTLAVAAAPLLIGLLQALAQQQQQQPAELQRNSHGYSAVATDPQATTLALSAAQYALRRLCASHVYVLLLLTLLECTQDCLLGWVVAALIVVVWWRADVRECGVLLRQRWLYRFCAIATATLALAVYVVHWAHERFPRWPAQRRFPWLLAGSESVHLTSACWTAAAACVALQWSSGGGSDEQQQPVHQIGNDINVNEESEGSLFRHPHGVNLIAWLRQRIGRHRGTTGIRGENAIDAFTATQRNAFLADAAELLGAPATNDDEQREHGSDARVSAAAAPLSVCAVHVWTTPFIQVARVVPFVGCGLVAMGATAAASSTSCLLSVLFLGAGLGVSMRHSRLQWSFWKWWRPLLVSCAVLPLAALLFGCPAVHAAVVALPPWVGLLVGLSDDGLHVSGDGLRFTPRHVGLFFALWLQSCLYNNPQWGLRLLRQQYAEQQLGEVRHAALQEQLVARVTRAMAEAQRVDREIRAYLDGLRAGHDAAETSITSDGADGGDGARRHAGRETEEEEAEEARENLADMPALPSFDAEMVSRRPSQGPPPTRETVDDAPLPPPQPSSPYPTVTVPRGEDGTAFPAPTAASFAAADVRRPASGSAWRWWHQRCERGLRATCNVLATYTYHPAEYRVGGPPCDGAADTVPALFSLGQLLQRTLFVALQVGLRHTPLALLACTLANALLTGCLWELMGLCYLVQVALAYHPYAPRLVYRCFGFYLIVGVLLKKLVLLWVGFDRTNSTPSFVIGTLLPLHQGSVHPWTSSTAVAVAERDSLRYDTLWMDLVTFAVLLLHDRVCVVHGVYVEGHVSRSAGVGAASPPRPASPAPANNSSSGAIRLSPVSSAHVTAAVQRSFRSGGGVRAAVAAYYANIVAVPGVGEDWYITYTTVDLLALVVLAVTYSRMTANETLTLQDNVQNNQLPGPMALLLCVSVLQLVVDRMLYVQRCMRLKALSNWICAVLYCVLYGWWRNTVAVSAHAAGNTYFSIKVMALVLSVTQVCRGYPVHRRRDAFTTHPGSLFHYSCFMVYRSIPFLWEVRTLIDWTVQHTALTLQEYLTLEDVCVYMYHCRERYVGRQNDKAKVGDAVTPLMKWLFGVSRLALILLALLGPLLYYSTYNPSSVANKATQLKMELSFFGAHDFFTTTVHDDTATPDGWWAWLARTRPTLASFGQTTPTEQTTQLMEFTSCSGSQWMASPQAMRQVLAGLRNAAASPDAATAAAEDDVSTAYILQSLEMTRSASSTTSSTTVSLVNRWHIPKATAQAMVRILERETGLTTTTTTTRSPDSSTTGLGASSDSGDDANTTSATLPFFYSPFAFNRASRLDVLPTDGHHPYRNRQHCTLELHHERDVALDTLVRYWCLQCAPLFPQGNVPAENTSSAAEWRCLTMGDGCDAFNYEDVNDTLSHHAVGKRQREVGRRVAAKRVPFYMVILSDSVVVGISFLRGIGIVALYTTFVLALGRLLRSVLANKASTLVFENMANPAALENMVRCIGIAREYDDVRLEHTIYLELIDLLRCPDRLFEVTGSLRCMFVDAGQDDVFRLGHVRRRDVRRSPESGADN